jgi:hypothetical protein
LARPSFTVHSDGSISDWRDNLPPEAERIIEQCRETVTAIYARAGEYAPLRWLGNVARIRQEARALAILRGENPR